jgi:hypothetical protein
MPDVDLIVPTIPGREESLQRCLDSFPGTNHVVITGQPTCGLGWIEGIKRSGSPYLLLCCDDIEAGGDVELLLDTCRETVDAGYFPAPVISRPDGSLESAGGDMTASGCLLSSVQKDWTPVDFTPLPFVSRAQIKKVRMIPAHYMTDVYLSHRGRQLGIETVLRTEYRLIHHHEMTGRRSPSREDDQLYREGLANGD